ncbi:MAG: alcohol dehydrogenase catalytic domain-containing protein [Acidobacteria bacterium]|nr:alcohol dehydrogenase catalytic domain-containing protein [Acidobacteriota bacterium]
MKAAIFEGPGRRLVVRDVEQPTPGRQDILVRVAACGLCHSDLHYLDHGVSTQKPPPLILGHEAAGVVEEAGDEVTGFAAGDRVLLPTMITCGQCSYCLMGRENLCPRQEMFGNQRDGAFAQYIAAPARSCFPLPAGISLAKACIIADALSTPYHAVKNRGRVQVGDHVAVIGCGGIGMNAVQCAALAGGRVIAIDKVAAKLELARTLGAAATINASQMENVASQVRKLTQGGADIVFEAIGRPETQRLGFDSLRRGGRLCLVGYSPDMLQLPAGKLTYFEIEVIGSLGCRRADYPALIELVRSGRLQLDSLISATYSLEDINLGFDALRQGESLRSVVLPNGEAEAWKQ